MKRELFSAAVLLALSGCTLANPVREAEVVTKPAETVEEAAVSARAAEFKAALAPMKVRGIGINLTSTIPPDVTPDGVAERVSRLGFNTLYCYITSEQELTRELREFLIACGKRDLKLELVLFQSDFRSRQRGNQMLRLFRKNAPLLRELGKKIAEFNNELPKGAKLAGVTAVYEPHTFTFENGAAEVPGLCFVWSEKTFGKDLDNDQLAKLSLEEMKKMQQSLGSIPMSVAVYDYYHEWAESGKISVGRITDFSGFKQTILIGTGSKPTEFVNGIAAECKAKEGLIVAVKIAGHTSVEQGALRRRDWPDLMRSLKLLVRSAETNRCGGVLIAPLPELVYMLYEKN